MAVHAHHVPAAAHTPGRLPDLAVGILALGHQMGGGNSHERYEHDPERRTDRRRTIKQAHRSDGDGDRQDQFWNPDVKPHGTI